MLDSVMESDPLETREGKAVGALRRPPWLAPVETYCFFPSCVILAFFFFFAKVVGIFLYCGIRLMVLLLPLLVGVYYMF